ncbi:hypothetical protein TNCV_3083661 [Trichonephila clavipes]|nr:hypothetical protein TNCV_3083661 [Trichonephila clavipes]
MQSKFFRSQSLLSSGLAQELTPERIHAEKYWKQVTQPAVGFRQHKVDGIIRPACFHTQCSQDSNFSQALQFKITNDGHPREFAYYYFYNLPRDCDAAKYLKTL